MQEYQMTSWSRKWGGARVVFTGTQQNLTSGQYKADKDLFPDLVNGYVPASTPVLADDSARTIEPLYAFSTNAVTAFSSGDTSFSIQLKKGWEGSRVRVGMVLGVCPTTDLTAEVKDPLTVTAVDRTNVEYDVVTVTGAARTATQIAAGTEMIEIKLNGGKYYSKVLPNGLLPYDVAKDPNCLAMTGLDAMFCHPNGVLLTNRVPVIPQAIRAYMRTQDVYIRYSTSKE